MLLRLHVLLLSKTSVWQFALIQGGWVALYSYLSLHMAAGMSLDVSADASASVSSLNMPGLPPINFKKWIVNIALLGQQPKMWKQHHAQHKIMVKETVEEYTPPCLALSWNDLGWCCRNTPCAATMIFISWIYLLNNCKIIVHWRSWKWHFMLSLYRVSSKTVATSFLAISWLPLGLG